jgi:hypothetical protein
MHYALDEEPQGGLNRTSLPAVGNVHPWHFPSYCAHNCSLSIEQGIEVGLGTCDCPVLLQLHSVPVHQPGQGLEGGHSVILELDLQVQALI